MNKVINLFGKHKKKLIGLIIVALSISGLSLVLGNKNQKGIAVITGVVKEDYFEQSVYATGVLEVKDKKDIFARLTSYAAEVLVEAGDEVKAGEVILKLDSDDLALKVAQTRAEYDEKQTELVTINSKIKAGQKKVETIKKEYQRTKALFDLGAVSSQQLEHIERDLVIEEENLKVLQEATLPLVKAQLEEAAVALKKAQNTLEKAVIKSPFDGRVLKLDVKEGQPVQEGTHLVTVGKLGELMIETGINEIDAAELAIGDKVEITSEGIFAEPFIGVIDYIAPIAELESTSQGEQTQVKIRVAVDNIENSKIKPGYNVNLKIILAEKEKALLVPYEGVTQREGKDVAFVVDADGYARKREITLGLSNALFFEVLTGLDKDEKVILNPTQMIKEGTKVMIHDQNR